ncbi:MAG: serine hydrolase [Gallionella sp.]|nr:serine hydrolase [Gallionella sp.]
MKDLTHLCGNLLKLLAGLLVTGCVYVPALPSSTTPAQRQAYLASRIDHVLDTQQLASQPGISVMITKNGETLYSRSKGMADINQRTPITADTIFSLASVSKPITAIAVMQLMERGRLSLDDSVLKWLPELPASWHDITLHHLLSHQSGIPDCCAGISLDKLQKLDGVGNQALLQHYIADDALLFLPGAGAQYSNTNYVILAEIIAKAAGISYAQYLHENIFTPLGMHSTYVYGDHPPAGTSTALNHGRTSKIYGMTIALTGSVGIFSSASDLSVLATALLSGKLVSRDTLRLMTTTQAKFNIGNDKTDYGYGWQLSENGVGLNILGHTGDEDGFVTIMRMNDKQGIVTILLTNDGKATKRIFQEVKFVAQVLYD